MNSAVQMSVEPAAAGRWRILPACGGSSNPPALPVSLAECLDARLAADRRVLAFTVDPVMETFERFLDLRDVVLPIRLVSLRQGPILVVAVPTECRSDPRVWDGLVRLKGYATVARRRAVRVTETAIRKQPMLENALLIADCAGTRCVAGERVRMLTHLVEQGGSAPLEDCASFMGACGDPVASVLALVARKAVWIDLHRPIGPFTRVHLARRHWH